MKTRLFSISLALIMSLSSLQAEASKRLGGGQSAGRQSSNVTQREAARPAPATPAQNTATPTPAQAQPAPAARHAARRLARAPISRRRRRRPGLLPGGDGARCGRRSRVTAARRPEIKQLSPVRPDELAAQVAEQWRPHFDAAGVETKR